MNRYYTVLMLCCAHMIFGMMEESTLPLSGECLLLDDLPAELILLLGKYPTFTMLRHSYCMSNDKKILALDGAQSTIKIFSQTDDEDFAYIQDISESSYPAVHPLGTALAVVRLISDKERCVESYGRSTDGKFVCNTSLAVDKPVKGLVFNKDGSRLVVNVLAGTSDCEKREYVSTATGELRPRGIMDRFFAALSDASKNE